MSRLLLIAGLMVLAPAFALAQPLPLPGTSKPIPVAQYGEAKPVRSAKAANCPTCANGPIQQAQAEYYAGSGPYGRQLQAQLWWEYHECSPDGCPKPVGCSNTWTEWKFIFGSCRQFFGTAGAATGHTRSSTFERP